MAPLPIPDPPPDPPQDGRRSTMRRDSFPPYQEVFHQPISFTDWLVALRPEKRASFKLSSNQPQKCEIDMRKIKIVLNLRFIRVLWLDRKDVEVKLRQHKKELALAGIHTVEDLVEAIKKFIVAWTELRYHLYPEGGKARPAAEFFVELVSGWVCVVCCHETEVKGEFELATVFAPHDDFMPKTLRKAIADRIFGRWDSGHLGERFDDYPNQRFYPGPKWVVRTKCQGRWHEKSRIKFAYPRVMGFHKVMPTLSARERRNVVVFDARNIGKR